MANANSIAIEGENEAKIAISQSEATRREKEAEALRRATAAEKIQTAKALQEAYSAEQEAESARAAREQATLEADVLVKAEIEKKRLEIAAEAEAEQTRRRAKGDADAIYMKMEAEARGIQEILSKQAQGFGQVVTAAGGEANDAIRLLISDKLENLVKLQVEAIQNLKIDKITVWDSGNDKDGNSSTANFVSSLMKSLPPIQDLLNMAGMELPDFLGKTANPVQVDSAAPSESEPSEQDQ